MVRIPAGADLELEVQLEGVAEGVLVTATVDAPLVGECARCLESFTSETTVRFQELFTLAGEDSQAGEPGDEEDSYRLDAGGLLDLEPALRDAVVLELPLSPLCEEGCQRALPRVRRPASRRRAGPRARGARCDVGRAEGLPGGRAGRRLSRR